MRRPPILKGCFTVATKKKEYVQLWVSYSDYFQLLSDAEVGRLARAMIEYKLTGEEPKISGNERFTWPAIRRDIDEMNEKLQAYSEKQSENGKKGGRPRTQSPEDENPKKPSLFQETQKSKGIRYKEKEKEISLKREDSAQVRRPTSVDEVREYCKERNNGVDPQRFWDFYTSKGWKVGNQPMQDWKAAVRTWERRDDFPSSKKPKGKAHNHSQRTYTDEELKHIGIDLLEDV